MTTKPFSERRFITGLILLFWGWQLDLLFLAIPFAIITEAGHLLPMRWELSRQELNRISDGCTVIYVLLLAIGLLIREGPEIIYFLLTWLPVAFFPLIVVTHYSNWQKIPLSTLSMRARRNEDDTRQVDITPPYLVGCLLAAAIPTDHPQLFYILALCFTGWILYPSRAGRFQVLIWLSAFLIAGLGGYIAHQGLRSGQLWLEKWGSDLIFGWMRDRDPYQRETALGSIGELNASNRILFRVDLPEGVTGPLLLREGVYNSLLAKTWRTRAVNDKFSALVLNDYNVWELNAAETKSPKSITIYREYGDVKGLLAVPPGVVEIHDLATASLETNQVGTLKVDDAPPLAIYHTNFNSVVDISSPSVEFDKTKSIRYQAALERISVEANLKELSKLDQIAAIEAFFYHHFRYSLDLTISDKKMLPINDFLLNSRTGHCEYFASATVLLLRHLGIPARYNTGYSVQEYSAMEKRYVVRGTHAHAWASAWIDGRWITVDTTPPDWSVTGSLKESNVIQDWISWAWFAFNHWRLSQGDWAPKAYWIWGIVPLIAFLVWRQRKRRRIRKTAKSDTQESNPYQHLDSAPLGRLLQFFVTRGQPKPVNSSLQQWLNRVLSGDKQNQAETISRLHYRSRFSPTGLNTSEEKALEESIEKVIRQTKP